MRDPVVRATLQDSATWVAGDHVAGPNPGGRRRLSKQQVPVLGSDAVPLSDGERAHAGCSRRFSWGGEPSAPAVASVPRTVPGGATKYLDTTCPGFGKSDWWARRPRVAAWWPQCCRRAYVSLIEPSSIAVRTRVRAT